MLVHGKLVYHVPVRFTTRYFKSDNCKSMWNVTGVTYLRLPDVAGVGVAIVYCFQYGRSWKERFTEI